MTLRVMIYNICEGGGDRLPAIARLLRGWRADVVALVESSSRPAVEALGQALGMTLVYGQANCPYGVAWLSRLPIRSSKNHRLATLSKTLLEIETEWHQRPLRLFATHLADRRQALTHPREDEVRTILGVLAGAGPAPQLLLGDLNAIRPGDPVGEPAGGEAKVGDALPDAPRRTIQSLLDAGYVDCYRALHPRRPGYTYPSRAPWLRLDYVFVSPAMAEALASCTIVDGELARRASDHLALTAEFRRAARSTPAMTVVRKQRDSSYSRGRRLRSAGARRRAGPPPGERHTHPRTNTSPHLGRASGVEPDPESKHAVSADGRWPG
jgi:exodeoxyribonuclease-3